MENDDSKMQLTSHTHVIDSVCAFRAQALCIKTNIQILRELWELQSYFKEKEVKAFYQVVQENCIFRTVLEAYKLLCDSDNKAISIRRMSHEVYGEMIQMEEFADKQQELLHDKNRLKADLNNYNEVVQQVHLLRNKVYAHSGKEHHWFSESYITLYGLDDDVYEKLYELTDICIGYCNSILERFGQKKITHYSNSDDVRMIFGLKTDKQKLEELFGMKAN